MNNEWRNGAACSGFPSGWWLKTSYHFNRLAYRICETCPVRQACLDDAIAWGGEHDVIGIRGGLSLSKRIVLRRELREANK